MSPARAVPVSELRLHVVDWMEEREPDREKGIRLIARTARVPRRTVAAIVRGRIETVPFEVADALLLASVGPAGWYSEPFAHAYGVTLTDLAELATLEAGEEVTADEVADVLELLLAAAGRITTREERARRDARYPREALAA